MSQRDGLWNLEFLVKDMLFDTDMSIPDMAHRLSISENELRRQIKKMGLDWARKKKKKMSRGQTALTDLMQKLLPGEEVVSEHCVGERLRLDVYVPSYSLGAEYHGRQHFHYSSLFHEDRDDFLAGQARDLKKEGLCREQGIALIVFRYNDKLTEDVVFDRMLHAIQNTPHVELEKTKRNITSSSYYQKVQQRNREYNKQQYRRSKERRKQWEQSQ